MFPGSDTKFLVQKVPSSIDLNLIWSFKDGLLLPITYIEIFFFIFLVLYLSNL